MQEWQQVSIDRVVLLTTYVLLNYVAKLRVRFSVDSFQEDVLLPVAGRQPHNDWVIYGYVSESVRVVRANDGSKSYGQWFLMSLEPDSTPERVKYFMKPENGGSCVIEIEKS